MYIGCALLHPSFVFEEHFQNETKFTKGKTQFSIRLWFWVETIVRRNGTQSQNARERKGERKREKKNSFCGVSVAVWCILYLMMKTTEKCLSVKWLLRPMQWILRTRAMSFDYRRYMLSFGNNGYEWIPAHWILVWLLNFQNHHKDSNSMWNSQQPYLCL